MADWIGINSSHIDSFCGETGGRTLAGALNSTDAWEHLATEVHWIIFALVQTYNVQKVRGRSFHAYDPIDVNIYVSDDKENWGAAVASGISTWQDTGEWVEIDVIDKNGRYVKVEIIDTESVDDYIGFGNIPSPFAIFDVYGEKVDNAIFIGTNF